MARPTDRSEAKAETLNIRVTPTLKRKLEAQAKISGRKLSAECEERLVQSMEQTERPKSSAETQDLLAEIERHIFDIEQATGAAWHKGLGTWAAVQEMLASGPIMAVVPAMASVTEKLAKIDEQQRGIEAERTIVIEVLKRFGITIYDQQGLLGSFWLGQAAKPSRELERQQLEAKDNIPAETREQLTRDIDRLEELDGYLLDLRQERSEAVEPLAEAIEKGRATYERPQAALPIQTALAVLDAKMKAALPKPKRRGMFAGS